MTNHRSSGLRLLTKGTIAVLVKRVLQFSIFVGIAILSTGNVKAQTEPCLNFTTQPCVLLNDIATTQVYVYSDDGLTDFTISGFLTGCPTNYCGGNGGNGGGGGEGLACLSGSSHVAFTTTNRNYINAFNLQTGQYVSTYSASGSGNVASLVVNSAGTILYAGQYRTSPPDTIFSLIPSASGLALGGMTSVPLGKQLALGSFGSTAGNVFANDGSVTSSGVNQYVPAGYLLNGTTPLQFLPGIPSSDCATFSGTQHCWTVLTGMAFDAAGNLWVNNYDTTNNSRDVGTFEFALGGTCGAAVCPLNFTTGYTYPGGPAPEPIGLTIAPPNDLSNPSYIMIGNYRGGTVSKIDPHSCNGSLTHPGTCLATLFINRIPENGLPKSVTYPQSCPNPDNDGNIEICKQSNPSYPVTGTFDFTITAPLFSSGEIAVPVGDCSGSIRVPSSSPSGAVTVTETPTIGDLVSNVTAYAYNSLGFYVNELESWTQPNLYATVGIQPGGVDLETIATFTNYAASPGQLKICKIAGSDNVVGQPFMFMVTYGQTQNNYVIDAGPADQGGYCQLAGTFPANAQVTVAEMPQARFRLTNLSVNPQDRGGIRTKYGVTLTIGAGITEVDFTNNVALCPTCR